MASDDASLQRIHEIGPEIAQSVGLFFREAGNQRVIDKLLHTGVLVQPRTRPTSDAERPLAGKSVVFTGTLQRWGREAATRRVEALGGRVTSSVSKKTDYVVAGQDGGSKLDQAKKLGIPIITEEGFEGWAGNTQERGSSSSQGP